MEIIKNDTTVAMTDLEPGTVFEYGGNLFIKTRERAEALILNDYSVHEFNAPDVTIVRKYESKLYLNL